MVIISDKSQPVLQVWVSSRISDTLAWHQTLSKVQYWWEGKCEEGDDASYSNMIPLPCEKPQPIQIFLMLHWKMSFNFQLFSFTGHTYGMGKWETWRNWFISALQIQISGTEGFILLHFQHSTGKKKKSDIMSGFVFSYWAKLSAEISKAVKAIDVTEFQ